jgi:hypothetical protein
MKKTAFVLSLILSFSGLVRAQSSAAWSFGIADTADIATGNLSYTQHIATASGSKILWAMLQNQAINYSTFYFGSYKLTEYDNAGLPGSSNTITGKLYFAYAKSDEAGNWYILGQYYDTVNFPGGPTFINPAPTSSSRYFIVKLNAGTLSCAWAKQIYYASTFTITSTGLYVPIDSGSVTFISKFDLTSGNRTDLFSQPFTSSTSSIAVDGNQNIYLAGACAFSGVNFNGHVVSTSGIPYPVYVVKYRADGSYAWHYLMSDITCPERQLTLATDNIIYYSGKVFDSFSFGSFFVHQPRWVYDYLVSRLDSTGNILWLRQQKDTLEGDASADNNCHAVAMADSSLSVFTQIRGYIDWGNGIVTDEGIQQNTAVVNYAAQTGAVNWVKPITGNTLEAKNIGGNGTDIIVTGNVYDSIAYHLDAEAIPVVPVTYTPYMAMLHTARASTAIQTVTENAGKFQVMVMPIPATNSLLVKIPSNITGNVKIRLYDISGREVLKTIASANPIVQLDVKEYSRGLYFIDISGDGVRKVQKIVLE